MSSSVASNDSDGDVGLMSALLGPRHSVRRSVRPSRQTCRITVKLTVRPGPLRLAHRDLSCIGDWLRRARSCRENAPFATLRTDRRITLSPLENMDCHGTTPGFWNGSVLQSRLVCWIRVLVRGYTRCPGSRPLT